MSLACKVFARWSSRSATRSSTIPRGVGLDDESLRTFQSIGLVDAVLPHTVPNQILRFFDAKRRLLAEMAPPDARFGWPKRNGFVQPLVDAELLAGWTDSTTSRCGGATR